jgi:hypothetical protein
MQDLLCIINNLNVQPIQDTFTYVVLFCIYFMYQGYFEANQGVYLFPGRAELLLIIFVN